MAVTGFTVIAPELADAKLVVWQVLLEVISTETDCPEVRPVGEKVDPVCPL